MFLGGGSHIFIGGKMELETETDCYEMIGLIERLLVESKPICKGKKAKRQIIMRDNLPECS